MLLDRQLEAEVALLRGTVLDLGGKKEKPRGRFRAEPQRDARWLYFNIDTSTRPHVLADAHQLPLAAESVDAVVCCEVLEHVRDASRCCAEVFRALKPGGRFFFSVPFLYPIHADPYDFRRFTPEGLRSLCAEFASVRIEPMGSWLGTMGMFLDLGAQSIGGGFLRGVMRKVLRAIGHFLCVLDFRGVAPIRAFTTGYFCVAVKSGHSEYDYASKPSREARQQE